ncbi:type II toxin-antitoxin system RnlB family antitoxin [Selenomonadales bacterium OttesenSCG-928-I06]|nr:type II toxin-antitoxin system RnlB family antitoxin [Selenomonadales bacterium OttesenSCG-928-I06]
MEEFVRFRIENDCHEVVFLKTVDDLYFFLGNIYDDLAISYGKTFTIIVDLFLQNGFSFNRFVELNFYDKETYTSSIVNPRDVSEEAKRKIAEYLKNHSELLYNSALSKNTIDFICADRI